ncbi:Dyp-type peroxidase [Salinibacterium sp. SWN1162]|uniref:Dyp-type peroxidase n=1 Tax=Salinibacterium sp. SWN1162 TaxID=2792053 RepID=UPI0018CECAB1|nr:Dyp-type peroxidase [Salinibacterium sp. SWN1162]MBH0008607.1 Dyp-type peroxidase [Salinibacterium sp. SWN1162]
MSEPIEPDTSRRLSRRHLLWGGAAAAGVGAATAAGVSIAGDASGSVAPTNAGEGSQPGSTAEFTPQEAFEGAVPFYGVHQAGIETPAQSNAVFIALDLRDDVDAASLRRLMGVLTDDAARLTAGQPALADSEPELAVIPAQLTVTFGFGPRVVALAGKSAPDWLGPLPAFGIDQLDPAYCDGDLLLQIAANDPLTVTHTARMLLKDARSFALPRWSQSGFRRAAGAENPAATMRNLFGQLDGTGNPSPGTTEFNEAVWSTDVPEWLEGGTSFVLRRIVMDLDGWDKIDRLGREETIGRTLDTGAPLTGTVEGDEPDLEAKDRLGFPVIPAFAHVRRAKEHEAANKMFRRGYNYDDIVLAGAESVSNSGLLFAAFQADVDKQFVPVQKALDTLDLLNTWTKPVGSAVFAIPPGCQPGGYIGDTLF